MAAKNGILGESTTTTIGTTTLYTVPADKSARVRVNAIFEGGSGTHEISMLIGSPGSEVTINWRGAGQEDNWTGTSLTAIISPNPVGSTLETYHGMQQTLGLNIDGPTTTIDWVVSPLKTVYFLSTGDTVKVVLATQNLADALAQVVGVEDDA